MSIIPYANNWQVVLRHNDQVVVYNPQSKQLGVRDVASQRGVEITECPYCHQPLHREERARATEHGGQRPDAPGFVSPEYFRMLRDSLPASAESSAPPSPRRRLVEPVRPSTGSSSGTHRQHVEPQLPTYPSATQGISADALSPGYFQRFFVVQKELGRGGKGVVLLVTHMLDNVELGQYACKRVPVGNDHEWLKNVLNEVRLLEHLSHQHLVYYKHVWLEDVKISNFGPSVPCAFILQQYCNAGDLQQYVIEGAQLQDSPESAQMLKERARRRSKQRPEPPNDLKARKLRLEEIYSFFKDITSGINHLHLNGFIHRDLKPSNCLLHDAGKGLRVLVSDFGEVQVENMVRKSTGATGTVSYCAPEVLRRSSSSGDFGNFTTKSDIFSLGMILYFLCFARLPYRHADHLNEENEDLDQLRDEIITWTGLHEERQIRPDLPEQLYTFLRRLLSLNPDDRPSAEEILLGIKTGSGLDEIADHRPNAAAHIFDDLSSSSRISPVDSPRASTPANRKNSPTTTGFVRPGGAPGMKLRMSSFQRDRALQNQNLANGTGNLASGTSSPTSPPANSPTTTTSDDSPFSLRHHPLTQTQEVTSDSLVLRPSFPSPTKIQPDSPNLPSPRMIQRGMLPPPPMPASRLPGFLQPFLSQTNFTQRTLPLTILLLKLMSLNWACNPMATDPTVAYPLLALAVADTFPFSPTSSHDQDLQHQQRHFSRRLLQSMILAGVHLSVMWLAKSQHKLCAVDGHMRGVRIGNDDVRYFDNF